MVGYSTRLYHYEFFITCVNVILANQEFNTYFAHFLFPTYCYYFAQVAQIFQSWKLVTLFLKSLRKRNYLKWLELVNILRLKRSRYSNPVPRANQKRNRQNEIYIWANDDCMMCTWSLEFSFSANIKCVYRFNLNIAFIFNQKFTGCYSLFSFSSHSDWNFHFLVWYATLRI